MTAELLYNIVTLGLVSNWTDANLSVVLYFYNIKTVMTN